MQFSTLTVVAAFNSLWMIISQTVAAPSPQRSHIPVVAGDTNTANAPFSVAKFRGLTESELAELSDEDDRRNTSGASFAFRAIAILGGRRLARKFERRMQRRQQQQKVTAPKYISRHRQHRPASATNRF